MKRNIENVVRAAELIASLPEDAFDMGDWMDTCSISHKRREHGCGSVGCIGGWISHSLADGDATQIDYSSRTATKFLGLTGEMANRLFFPPGLSWPRKDGRDHAVGALLRIAEGKDLPESWWDNSDASYACDE